MAFTKLNFTRVWTSKEDFPTIQTNETTVRADMQALHNETRTAFNNLIDALEDSTTGGASNISITSITGRDATTVQGALEELDTDIKLNNTARHTHSNKALLDTYTQTEANLADAVTKKHSHSNKPVLDTITDLMVQSINSLISIFTGISRVTTSLTALDTDIPTCKAVTDAMSEAGNGDMMKSAYATQSSTKVDTALDAEMLGGYLPADYASAEDLSDVEEALDLKADLVNGKVPGTQLPDLNYIPLPENPSNGDTITYNSTNQTWEPTAFPTPDPVIFVAGTTAPTNTNKLWIDTTETTGGLKYYDTTTSTWKHVPVAFS